MEKTPEKITTPDKRNSRISPSSQGKKKTPNKRKRTPLKLFNKSPKKLEEFNVHVINNFIKITPSKCNNAVPLKVNNNTSSAEKPKSQASILKYTSPVQTTKSMQVQKSNESTPIKISTPSPIRTPKRTKLDFSDCGDKHLTDVTNLVDNTKTTPSKCNNNNHKLERLPEMPIELGSEEDVFNDVDWEVDFTGTPEQFSLDLTHSQHCKIIDLEPRVNNSVLIKVQCTKTSEKALIKLEGFWAQTKLKLGDIVHVSGSKDNNYYWLIDNSNGLLVFEPDLLISSTTVVNTLYCKRKRILAEHFKGVEPENKIMLVGTIVHSILQTVLRKNEPEQSLQQIEEIATDLISAPSMIRKLYNCSVTLKEIQMEVNQFMPRIKEFINRYVSSNYNNKIDKNNWNGTITSVDDIEENLWCPELGLKGKIDVTVCTKSGTLPLELKTGRATVSIEHRGQVILYIMMMNKLGFKKINSGLLLYLREGVALKEVPITVQETRDLIILRNELSYYLTKQNRLPEPINNKRACDKCEYNIICASYMRQEHQIIPEYFNDIQETVLEHLTESHIKYFLHWTNLLSLEGAAQSSGGDSKSIKDIYTVAPSVREQNGRCLNDLKIINTDSNGGELFEHTFEKAPKSSEFNFLTSGIIISNYVVISTEKRPAVATGFVTNITKNTVSVSLDRNLNTKYKGQLFILDTYDSMSTQSCSMGNLSALLENNERSKELREIIIDKVKAVSLTKLPKSVAQVAIPILKKCKLNKVQQRAVLKSIATQNYLLIKGMPGTGKTQTILTIVQLLVQLGKSVLITSHTHSAVDNVCLKLQERGIDVLRLGVQSKINDKLKSRSEFNLTKNCKSPEEIEIIFNSAQVIGVTCLGSGHPLLLKRTIDFCLVDESTQVLQPTVIRPLLCAKAFILIGDPDQLPPVIRNFEAIKLGMSESLFERLNTPESTMISLNLNYRMNRTITNLANALTYKGELLIGSKEIENATLKIPHFEKFVQEVWIKQVLNCDLEAAVTLIDTGEVWKLDLHQNCTWTLQNNDTFSQSSGGYTNLYEIGVVVTLIKVLQNCGVPNESIGVIAPYRAQVAQFTALLNNNIEVSTIDQYQGKDKEVIFYSSTKSRQSDNKESASKKYEILNDHRRLNVAVTRAKHKLIIVSDVSTVKNYAVFNKLFDCIERNNVVKLEDKKDGFDWSSVLKL